jgi:hypothetical protein
MSSDPHMREKSTVSQNVTNMKPTLKIIITKHTKTAFKKLKHCSHPVSFLLSMCLHSYPTDTWRQIFFSSSPPPPQRRSGGSITQAWMPTYVSVLRIPQTIWVWGAMVEWYIDWGKQNTLDKNLSKCHFVYHKSHMDWPGREPEPPRWEAGD